MGQDFRHLCQIEARRLLWMVGMVFAVTIMVQYFELPYGGIILSLFSGGKTRVDNLSTGYASGNLTNFDDLNSTNSKPIHDIRNVTNTSEGKEIAPKDNFVSEGNKESDSSLERDEDSDPEDESPFKNFIEENDSMLGNTEIGNGSEAPGNFAMDRNSSLGSIKEETTASRENKSGIRDADFSTVPSVIPPIASSPKSNAPTNLDNSSQGLVVSSGSNSSSMGKDVGSLLPKDEKSEIFFSDAPLSDNGSSKANAPAMNQRFGEQTAIVVSIAEMNSLLLESRASSFSMKPHWSSTVDKDLMKAKLQIQNVPVLDNDSGLYAPLYHNVTMFRRSYELMEQILKVYVYKEGERPIFHQPVLKGIYASEGWFMKQLKANKHFVTKNPRNAHLFYLPFSSRMLEETLYVPNSHNRKNLIQHLKNYLDVIVAKYNFWNRTGGADHFLVGCHDWAPSETRQWMANCIRALCNSDVKEGFEFGKDVSLPETFVRLPQNPLRELGGKPPSQRRILAFFAGSMHGYLRPILLQHWENKDPDMKIFGKMRKTKGLMNYVQHMKSSKYCICAKGYEVNSPRVVEAIFYECVPVIISDNFVPPFFEILNWESFAVFVPEKDIPNLKNILLSIPQKRYLEMQRRVKKVQQHFLWHSRAVKYDIFHMILHSVWFNRVFRMGPR